MLTEYEPIEYDLINSAANESTLQPYLHSKTRGYAKSMLKEIFKSILTDIIIITEHSYRMTPYKDDLNYVIASYKLLYNSTYSEINYEEYSEDEDGNKEDEYLPEEDSCCEEDEDDSSLDNEDDNVDYFEEEYVSSNESSPERSVISASSSSNEPSPHSASSNVLSPANEQVEQHEDSPSSTDSSNYITRFQQYLVKLAGPRNAYITFTEEFITAFEHFIKRQLVLSFDSSPHCLFTRMGYNPLGLINYYFIYSAPTQTSSNKLLLDSGSVDVDAIALPVNTTKNASQILQQLDIQQKLYAAEQNQSQELIGVLKDLITELKTHPTYQEDQGEDGSSNSNTAINTPSHTAAVTVPSTESKALQRLAEEVQRSQSYSTQLEKTLQDRDLEKKMLEQKYLQLQSAVTSLYSFTSQLASLDANTNTNITNITVHNISNNSISMANTPVPKYNINKAANKNNAEEEEIPIDEEVVRNTRLNTSSVKPKMISYSNINLRKPTNTSSSSSSSSSWRENAENLDPKTLLAYQQQQEKQQQQQQQGYTAGALDVTIPSSNIYDVNPTTDSATSSDDTNAFNAVEELDRLIYSHNASIVEDAATSSSSNSNSGSNMLSKTIKNFVDTFTTTNVSSSSSSAMTVNKSTTKRRRTSFESSNAANSNDNSDLVKTARQKKRRTSSVEVEEDAAGDVTDELLENLANDERNKLYSKTSSSSSSSSSSAITNAANDNTPVLYRNTRSSRR